jgi:predicted glycosyltransferase
VLDDPKQLRAEWKRKNAAAALEEYYDEIWIYGLPQICEPLVGVDLPASTRRKTTYTGYLQRFSDTATVSELPFIKQGDPFILVTPGGGGDGEELVDWVIRAYESDASLPHRSVIVLGPFMQSDRRAEFIARVDRLPQVEAITFDAHLESLMDKALAVVAMGGYNTFCEILSFDKRALVVPRTEPRQEQLIRASRAAELGLLTMLRGDAERKADVMATALRHLPQQNLPSRSVVPGLLDGLENVNILTRRALEHQTRPSLARQRA